MKNDVKIRDCTIDDAAMIAEIYNESILAGNATMDDEPKSVAKIRKWIEDFNDRETILILENSEEIIGWGIIKRYSDRRGYRYACETAVYISAKDTVP
ncbi:MAG: GNAT family N-acetyltransferase [bacterium]